MKTDTLEIETNVYVKSTNIHQYVEYSSCHPKACKNGIPFSQAKRYRRITSNDECFLKSLEHLRSYFWERNYPVCILNDAFNKAS